MTTPPLSPAAQAVLDAFCASEWGVYLEGDPERIAAALRALTENEAESHYLQPYGKTPVVLVDRILAIANELDPQP
jgi:hypothetical protein